MRAFTLIEILVVIGMIGILASTVLVAINPLHQFAQARNTQRINNVQALLNAVGNRIADSKGLFPGGTNCSQAIPQTQTVMGMGSSAFDIRPCLVPLYISELPTDPSVGTNSCTNDLCTGGTYTTGYTIAANASHRITVCAPESVHDGMDAPYCLSR